MIPWIEILLTVIGLGVAGIFFWLRREFWHNDEAHKKLFADHTSLGNSVRRVHRRIDHLISHSKGIPPFNSGDDDASED